MKYARQGNVRQVYSRILSPCQPNRVNRQKRLWKQSIGALLLLFTFSLISWLTWLTKERNTPNIRLFSVNWLSTKASTKLSTGGFSEWQFHLPGFFFRDFLKTVPLRRVLVDTLPAFLRTVFLIPLRAFVSCPALNDAQRLFSFVVNYNIGCNCFLCIQIGQVKIQLKFKKICSWFTSMISFYD